LRSIKTIIKDWIRNVKRGVPNLITWFPVIWKDRWWDYYFFFVILHKKLSLMEKGFRKYGNCVSSKEDAIKIKVCVNLLDRIIKDEYDQMVYKKHDEKWGDIELKTISRADGLPELIISRPNVVTDKEIAQEKKEQRLLIEKPDKMKYQDKDLLFKLLKKHILSWWD
jgi:hypothetical protein